MAWPNRPSRPEKPARNRRPERLRRLLANAHDARLHVPHVLLLEIVRRQHLHGHVKIDHAIKLNIHRVDLQVLKAHLLVWRAKRFDLACREQGETNHLETLLPNDIGPRGAKACGFRITTVHRPTPAAFATFAVLLDHSVNFTISGSHALGPARHTRGFQAIAKFTRFRIIARRERDKLGSYALFETVVPSNLPIRLLVQLGVCLVFTPGLLTGASTAAPGAAYALPTHAADAANALSTHASNAIAAANAALSAAAAARGGSHSRITARTGLAAATAARCAAVSASTSACPVWRGRLA